MTLTGQSIQDFSYSGTTKLQHYTVINKRKFKRGYIFLYLNGFPNKYYRRKLQYDVGPYV